MKDMPDVDIHKSLFTFTPKYLQLSETTVNIGKNDLTADSRFENYLGYTERYHAKRHVSVQSSQPKWFHDNDSRQRRTGGNNTGSNSKYHRIAS